MTRPVRGTKDLFKAQLQLHEAIIAEAERISNRYGFEPCSVPILEYSGVFSRALGLDSDLVNKEMYTFLDRSGESVTLRPEFTAGVMRAVGNANNCIFPSRLRSCGPLFRYDRPQAGRQRQFHQCNFEHIGVASPVADAEMIKMVFDILDSLNVLCKLELKINSLGCKESRALYRKDLVSYFQNHESALSEASRVKILSNPLSILDSKHLSDRAVVENAPLIKNYYTDASNVHWNSVQEYLNRYQIKYVIDSRLVRGLEYYTHTVFEFAAESLSSQSAVVGGGRYDGLASLMFEKDLPAVGCAIGIERVALLIENKDETECSVVLIPVSQEYIVDSMHIAQRLRCCVDVPVTLETEGSLKMRMKKAHSRGTRYAVFTGPKERESGSYTLRNLISGMELLLEEQELIQHFHLLLKKSDLT
jgi:histidyl-tRNA synthetase